MTAQNARTDQAHTLAASTEFTIGSEVSCPDGTCLELRRVVVDPVARALTHLVVEEKHRPGTGHLVPIDLVSSSGTSSSGTGHLWGKKKVAIPIGPVTGVEAGVRLNLTKDEVRDLPVVDLADEE